MGYRGCSQIALKNGSEILAKDQLENHKSCDLQDFYCCMKKKRRTPICCCEPTERNAPDHGQKHFNKLVMLSQEIYVPASDGLLSH